MNLFLKITHNVGKFRQKYVRFRARHERDIISKKKEMAKNMKLTYKGICNDFSTLDKGVLPENAVKFREPDTAAALNARMFLFMIPTAAVIGLVVLASFLIYGELRFELLHPWAFWAALVLHIVSFIPHELLHAVTFPKNHPVSFYISPKNLVLFVCSVEPVSKRRFIWLSLCPNIILGWLPLVAWFFAPPGVVSTILLFVGAFNTLSGAGDYMNVFNTLRQMPKSSFHQHSGMNSYWYLP